MTKPPPCLGLDCGGTKSRYAWSPAGARPDGLGGAVQPALQGAAAAAAALAGVLQKAAPRGDVAACVAAIAGAGDQAVAQQIAVELQRLGIRYPIAVVGDVVAAAAAALAEAPGVLVWAGTGSFAVARSEQGRLHRTGGRGHLLGDQGSGYDLVRRAAAAAVLAVDGLAEPTALAAALVRATSASSPARLGAVLQRLDAGAVAALLPVVLECAARGDGVAQLVLADGADALAMVANAAVRHAGIDWRGLPVTFGGGVLAAVDAVRDLVQQRLQSFGAGEFQVVDEAAAARGAAALAHALHERSQPLLAWIEDGPL